jgi:hypothetical protein
VACRVVTVSFSSRISVLSHRSSRTAVDICLMSAWSFSLRSPVDYWSQVIDPESVHLDSIPRYLLQLPRAVPQALVVVLEHGSACLGPNVGVRHRELAITSDYQSVSAKAA